MMKWLSYLLGKSTTDEHGADELVPDSEYEFKFGTKPMLPEGLQDLRITELGDRLLILENFDIDLTVDQSYMDATAERIAMASRCLRLMKTCLELDTAPQPPVRLHRQNVLISGCHYTDQHKPEDDIVAWLKYFGWEAARPSRSEQVTTDKPLEDGYFSCMRILRGDGEGSPALNWSERNCDPNIVDCLAAFVQEETERIGRCEDFLRKSYDHLPANDLTHPVFTLLDFPIFDMGIVEMTFSGSIWSDKELRFWSRPTCYHK